MDKLCDEKESPSPKNDFLAADLAAISSVALVGEEPLVIFCRGDDNPTGVVALIRINLEFCLFAAGFLNGGDHALRSFGRNRFVQAAGNGIDGNLGEIRGPLVKIRSHIPRPFPADSTDDRGDGCELLRIMRGPSPRAIATHADAREIDSPFIHRQRRLDILEQEVEVFRRPDTTLSTV